MNTPALLALAAFAFLAGAAFLFHRFPHWGMRHHHNRPAPGVTEARYRQMYGDEAWRHVRRRTLGLSDTEDEFTRGLLARLREEDHNR